MKGSSLETVLKGIRTVLLGNGSSKGMLVVFEFLLAGVLGAAGFGYYAIAVSMVQIVSTICLLGLNFGVVQYLAKYEETGEYEKKKSAVLFGLLSIATASGVMAILVYACAPFLAQHVFSKPEMLNVLKVAAPLIFFDAVSQGVSAVFRGLRQFRISLMASDFIKNAVSFLFVPVLLYVGASAQWALAACVLGSLIGLAFGLWRLRKEGYLSFDRHLDKGVIADIYHFSKMMFLFNLLQVLAVRFFIVVAGIFLTAEETGTLAAAARLALLFIFFHTAVNVTIHAEFVKLRHRMDFEGTRDLYQSVTQGLLGVITVPALILLCSPGFIVHLIWPDHTISGWIIWPLLFANFLNTVTGPAGQVMVAHEKHALLMRLTLMDLAMEFIGVVGLTYAFGIVGAAFGEAARLLIFVVVRLWVLNAHLSIHPFGRSYVPLSVLSLTSIASGMALSAAGVNYFIAAGSALALYVMGAVWIIVRDGRMVEELGVLLHLKLGRGK
jgi:O-antigen/teichoic acid export membrane protein